MMMQTGRYLIGCYREAKSGIEQAASVGYLNSLEKSKRSLSTAKTVEEICNLEDLATAYNCICANLVSDVGEQYLSFVGTKHEDDAYEMCAVGMLTAAKAHCYGFLLRRFIEAIGAAEAELKPILTKLATLYALYNILETVGTYALQSGYYTPAQFALIRSQVPVFCQVVRQDANPLVDSFGLTDFIVNSPLGRYDGDIYRHYFDKVKRARKHPTPSSLFFFSGTDFSPPPLP